MRGLLRIQDLKKEFHLSQMEDKKIIGCSHINLTLHEGDFIGITGKSGAGKSTIIKCIYRTYLPTEGVILYHSEQFGPIDLVTASERKIIAIRKKEIGYVSQFLKVMPRVTALEVVRKALLEKDVEPQDADIKAKNMLEHFQLPKSLWNAYPNTFSGGEKLRLNLASAMVKQPKLLLLDEPTASLDAESKLAVKEMIMKLKEAGTSMLGIFHDLEFMEGVVDKEYHISHGVMH